MHWGKWIVVSFVSFALFIGVLVFFCLREDISLVSQDYYKDELAFQEQIERLKNAESLKSKPVIRIIDQDLVIQFALFKGIEHGELRLFRPSDQHYDRNFLFKSENDTLQRFDLRNLPAGMYKAQLKWSGSGKEYFIEEIVNL